MYTDKTAELLQQAADAFSRPSSVSSGEEQKRFHIEQPSSSNAPVLRSPSVSDRVRGLFAPYSGFARKPSVHVGGPSWAHRFCALAIADQVSNIVFRKKKHVNNTQLIYLQTKHIHKSTVLASSQSIDGQYYYPWSTCQEAFT